MLLDHLILPVNEAAESVTFYTGLLGFELEREDPPFTVLRVSPDLTLQLAPWGSAGGMHLAFAMSAPEFEEIAGRIRTSGIEFGDAFDSVGNMKGPGEADGARGRGPALYCFDPSRHLIEIRHYGEGEQG